MTMHLRFWAAVLGVVSGLCGCSSEERGAGAQDAGEVVLYTSLNEPTTRAVTDLFQERTGIEVQIRADTERDKTVGLVRRILEERERPRADVFWCSESAHMVRLAGAGVLRKPDTEPASAARIPQAYRDPEGIWFGFAARARVLIVNTELVPKDRFPSSMWDIVTWDGELAPGIVRPVTGTTLTHIAALYEVLGADETDRFLDQIQAAGVNLPAGNGSLAKMVGEGQLPFGFTDSSDFRLVKNDGHPVEAVYPDQDGIGTLVIPNTVALVRGGPNPANAERLLEFLLSDEVEQILAHHPRGHIPLKPGIDHPPQVRLTDDFRVMDVDLTRIGSAIEERLTEMNARFP